MIAILLVLGIYLFLVEFPAEKNKIDKELSDKMLVDIKEEDITSFSIYYIDREILFVKQPDGNWGIKKPVESIADTQAVNDFISLLVGSEINKVVDESPKDLSVYGLDMPDIIVSLIAKDKKIKILMGDKSPIIIYYYLMREGDKRVLLSNLALKRYLSERDIVKKWEKKIEGE